MMRDNIQTIIGVNIKKARKEKHLTQVQLATASGLSRSFICDVENGRYMPSLNVLLMLAKPLDVDLNFFVMQ